jgi:hypothetical protein
VSRAESGKHQGPRGFEAGVKRGTVLLVTGLQVVTSEGIGEVASSGRRLGIDGISTMKGGSSAKRRHHFCEPGAGLKGPQAFILDP